jgi:hypothetical protein
VPPDLTRRDSRAGELTHYVYKYCGRRLEAVLPASGTAPFVTGQVLVVDGGFLSSGANQ